MLFMKAEMFGTQKSAMPLLFSKFDFLPIYKANSAGLRTCPFLGIFMTLILMLRMLSTLCSVRFSIEMVL